MEIGAGFADDFGAWAFKQLQSVAALILLAEVGALSKSSSVMLSWSLKDPPSDFVVSVLCALSPVEVRFRGALLANGAVSGGLAMAGEAGLMVLRKSIYASGGVIGVFSGLSSSFAESMLGVGGYSRGADGRPAEGRPAE